jgi:hypothetical protein
MLCGAILKWNSIAPAKEFGELEFTVDITGSKYGGTDARDDKRSAGIPQTIQNFRRILLPKERGYRKL